MVRRRNGILGSGAAALVLGTACLADSAGAGERDLTQVRVSTELLDEIVQGLLPATVTMARPVVEGGERALRLQAIRYCGAGEKGGGRWRATATLGRDEGQEGQKARGPACRGRLTDAAEHASPPLPEGTVLVDLEASWKHWELKVSAVRGVLVGQGGRIVSPLGLDQRAELFSVSTSDLRIDTRGGAPIVLHAIPAFREAAIDLAILVADQAPARPPRLPPAGREVELAGVANVAAEIPVEFANQVLRLLTGKEPLSIPVQGDEVDIQNVALAGAAGTLSLTGTATPRSVREPMRWTLLAAGEPLGVSSLRIVAPSEDCTALGTMAALACGVRNGARVAAAEAFGRGLTQRYQGQLVHELASPLSLRFSFAGQRIDLHGDLLRTAFSSAGLSVVANLAAR